ncbi:MAG: molecular chaperone DnaK [Sulfurovum sp.]|nr:MAG: molecular chaperone DnaK [Sulfurovum sp.]
MNTRMVDSLYKEADEMANDFFVSWKNFLTNIPSTDSLAKSMIEETFEKVEPLIDERWVIMEGEYLYDHKIQACWLYEYKEDNNFNQYLDLKFGKRFRQSYVDNIKEEMKKIPSNMSLPTKKELVFSFSDLEKAPFPIETYYKRPKSVDYILWEDNNQINAYCLSSKREYSEGDIVPLFRLHKKSHKSSTNREIFFLWILNGLLPTRLKEDSFYKTLLNFEYEVENFLELKSLKLHKAKISISSDKLIAELLLEDKKRADIQEYHEKMLLDIEQGHWSLWQDESTFKKPMAFTLTKKLVARDPKSSIVNGVVGIDFGTKSTVVAYQKETTKIYPMRVGTGNLAKTISAHHYENPTIMEFNDLEEFVEDYNSREGRPYTSWENLTISHTAFSSLMNSKSDDFNAYISELKQWAGNKDKKLKMVDKKGYILDLAPFIDIGDNDINPIEIYAYYLGLHINNQHNGIYMNYILSFPVTYEIDIRDKIVESFRKGIKKSLPQELHAQRGEVGKLSVKKGASEPAAYAIVALQEYGFEPEDYEKIFYGVFDFGGGTTDFDFGIFREANGKKERRYDYAIEHFRAGGDRYLGGENLLERLAFEVFKNNKDELLAEKIQFILPPECDEFLGSEMLVSQSREAKMNTKIVMEKLRPFWEQHEDSLDDFDKDVLGVNLTNINGQNLANFELTIDKNEMFEVLENRIEKGVKNFFESLKLAFNHKDNNLNTIDEINIFLAGNSSKSPLVSKIFEREIEKNTKELKGEDRENEKEYFKIFQPLGHEDGNLNQPTGKTGVAFGLIESREGGKILVIDHNIKENINFKYYLGESRRKKFKVVLDREQEYNEWVEFIDATQETFEVYYSSQPLVSTNKIAIDDNSIKKRILKIDKIDDEAFIYLRIITPTTFEYVVAHEDQIASSTYLQNVVKVTL